MFIIRGDRFITLQTGTLYHTKYKIHSRINLLLALKTRWHVYTFQVILGAFSLISEKSIATVCHQVISAAMFPTERRKRKFMHPCHVINLCTSSPLWVRSLIRVNALISLNFTLEVVCKFLWALYNIAVICSIYKYDHFDPIYYEHFFRVTTSVMCLGRHVHALSPGEISIFIWKRCENHKKSHLNEIVAASDIHRKDECAKIPVTLFFKIVSGENNRGNENRIYRSFRPISLAPD